MLFHEAEEEAVIMLFVYTFHYSGVQVRCPMILHSLLSQRHSILSLVVLGSYSSCIVHTESSINFIANKTR